MSNYILNQEQKDSLVRLTPEQRYNYTLPKVADWEQIWSLAKKDVWIYQAERDFLVWPHPEFAAMYAENLLEGAEPKSISLSDWVERWCQSLEERGQNVLVFPTFDSPGHSVEPLTLRRQIADACLSVGDDSYEQFSTPEELEQFGPKGRLP